jgi:hypothetical protein
MRRKGTKLKKKVRATNININKVKVAPNIINTITIGATNRRRRAPPKSQSAQRIFNLGYTNTTPNGELLELYKRINNLDINRVKEQQQANGVAVGIGGYMEAQKIHKEEPLPPLETVYSSPQVSIIKQEENLKHPSSVHGGFNDYKAPVSGIKLDQIKQERMSGSAPRYEYLFKKQFDLMSPELKPQKLDTKMNKQRIEDYVDKNPEMKKRISQRATKGIPPKKYSP